MNKFFFFIFFIIANAQGYVGMAYQTWNKPLGVWQSKDELEYDFIQMKNLGIKSLRVELVWNLIEPKEGQYDFSKSDLLISMAQKYGFTIMPIIGFQWPPEWFPEGEYLGNERSLGPEDKKRSSLLNYASPWARKKFNNFISKVIGHYKGNKTVSAWILGNEFSYLEYNEFTHLGYDVLSNQKFNQFLKNKYEVSATRFVPAFILNPARKLNQAWASDYKNFDQVKIWDLKLTSNNQFFEKKYQDLLDFRRSSIASFIGEACLNAKKADPGAKISYSSIGVLFNPEIRMSTSEDFRSIAKACADNNAPLDFYGLNSYMNLNSKEGFHLSLSTKYVHALTGIPVVLTEFGFTSTEEYANIRDEKQSKYLKASILENIFDGIMTPHIFTLIDKPYVSFREYGFGMMSEKRRPKQIWHDLAELEKKLNNFDTAKLHSLFEKTNKKVFILTLDDGPGFHLWNHFWNDTWILASMLQRINLDVEFITPENLLKNQRTSEIGLLVLNNQGLLPLEKLKKITKHFEDNSYSLYLVGGMTSKLAAKTKTEKKELQDIYLKLTRHNIDVSDDVSADQYRPLEMYFKKNNKLFYSVINTRNLVYGDFYSELPDYITLKQNIDTPIAFFGDNSSLVGTPIITKRLFKDKYVYFTPFDLGAIRYQEKISIPDMAKYNKNTIPHLGNFITAVLDSNFNNDLFKNREHLVWTPIYDYTVPIFKSQILKNDGRLYFFQVLDELGKIDQGYKVSCSKNSYKFDIVEAKPNSKFIGLISGKQIISDKKGRLTLELKTCDSEVFIDENTFSQIKTKPVFFEQYKINKSREELFPDRILVIADKKNNCITEEWLQKGFEFSDLGITHDKNYKNWQVEKQKALIYFHDVPWENIKFFKHAIVLDRPQDVINKLKGFGVSILNNRRVCR